MLGLDALEINPEPMYELCSWRRSQRFAVALLRWSVALDARLGSREAGTGAKHSAERFGPKGRTTQMATPPKAPSSSERRLTRRFTGERSESGASGCWAAALDVDV